MPDELKSETKTPKQLPAFSRSLPMALLRAREIVMERFRPSLRAHDLTDQQWRVLRALEDHGQKDLSELAEMCCLLKPSLTRIIRSLEGRGFLVRQQDAQDQRRSFVTITPAGRKLIALVAPHSEKIYQSISSDFGDEELDDLYRKLDVLMDKLGNKK